MDGQPIAIETGQRLRAWAGETDRVTGAPEGGAETVDLEELCEHAAIEANKGTAALDAWWNTLTRDAQVEMKPHMEDFKAEARVTDARAQDAAA